MMILQLVINNYAIIERLEIDFSSGLNIITGETGAGKSILIGALEAVLGGKAGSESVKTGAAQATIEALFDLEGIDRRRLEALGLEPGEELTIKRKIHPSGKSHCWVNGSPVTRAVLNKLGLLLMDIHGQHVHQQLLYPENHVDFLDEAGGLLSLRQEYFREYKNWLGTAQKLQKEKEFQESDRQRRELMEYRLEEINLVNPLEGEFAGLKQEQERLDSSREIQENCREANDLLSNCDTSVSHLLSLVIDRINRAAAKDSQLEPAVDKLEEMSGVLDEVSFQLERRLSGLQTAPERLREIEERLAELSGLAYKIKCEVEELPRIKEKLELEAVLSRDQVIQKLCRREAEQKEKLEKLAEKLSGNRKRSAARIQEEIERELAEIGMPRARFRVVFGENRSLSPTGIDRVEFYFSANPGEAPKKLIKIASGGELSRIMLALKSIQADRKGGRSVVFDEVDAGIGGQTALEVGKRLKLIAGNQQVICITHLHHIARFADNHLVVRKRVSEGRTEVLLKPTDRDGQIEELARMLAGGNIDDKVMEHASSLLA
ncbi:MAG: DNA repair protein RecN [bacterium]